jgi:SAM-dependent methyltransferase
MADLGRWFRNRQHSPWLKAEQACCALLLSQTVAGHAIQFELDAEVPEFLPDSPAVFHHRFQLKSDARIDGACRGYADELPLASNSAQLLVSHHSHEFGDRLEARLSEWSRILVANGTLVLLSFNRLRRSSCTPASGLDCLRPDQLSRKLRTVGLVPTRVRAVLSPENSRADRILHELQQAFPVTESGAAALAAGYVMLARKVDAGAGARRVGRMSLKQIEQGVQGTATG